jgi:hypothetical protein
MNVKLRTYITGFGVALGIAFAPTSQAEQINIRVYVVDDANLPEIRTTLMERGAVVRDFLPEGAFAATVDSSVAPLLAEIAGVLGTEAVTAPSAPRRMAVAGVPPLQPAGVKLLPPDQVLQRDTAAKVQPITSVAPSMFGRRRALALGGTTRPSKADNSLSVYFPPIGDQDGRPSCAAWAACYYWSTYTQARDEDVSLAGVTWLGKDERIPPCPNAYNADGSWNDAEYQICAKATNYTWIPPRPSGLTGHIASPAFLYPLINHGVAGPPGGGTYYTMGEVMQFLNRVGCGSWAKWPYDDWVPDGERWPSEDQWIEALGRRTQQTHSIDLSTTSGLDALRQVLVNGDIVITSGPLYQNWFNFWDPSCQSNGTCKGIDNDVYFASDGKAYDGHAVTVVGYDDLYGPQRRHSSRRVVDGEFRKPRLRHLQQYGQQCSSGSGPQGARLHLDGLRLRQELLADDVLQRRPAAVSSQAVRRLRPFRGRATGHHIQRRHRTGHTSSLQRSAGPRSQLVLQ